MFQMLGFVCLAIDPVRNEYETEAAQDCVQGKICALHDMGTRYLLEHKKYCFIGRSETAKVLRMMHKKSNTQTFCNLLSSTCRVMPLTTLLFLCETDSISFCESLPCSY